MTRWNSSVDDLRSTLQCSLANGTLTTAELTEIEIGESASHCPRSSILHICKSFRRKLAAPSVAKEGVTP